MTREMLHFGHAAHLVTLLRHKNMICDETESNISHWRLAAGAAPFPPHPVSVPDQQTDRCSPSSVVPSGLDPH